MKESLPTLLAHLAISLFDSLDVLRNNFTSCSQVTKRSQSKQLKMFISQCYIILLRHKAFHTVRIDGLLLKLFKEFGIKGRMWLAIRVSIFVSKHKSIIPGHSQI